MAGETPIASLIADLDDKERHDKAEHTLRNLLNPPGDSLNLDVVFEILSSIQSLSCNNIEIAELALDRVSSIDDARIINPILQIFKRERPKNYYLTNHRTTYFGRFTLKASVLLDRFESPDIIDPLIQMLDWFCYLKKDYEGDYELKWDEELWQIVKAPFLKMPNLALIPLARLAATGSVGAARMLAEIEKLVSKEISQLHALRQTLGQGLETLSYRHPAHQYIGGTIYSVHGQLESISQELDRLEPQKRLTRRVTDLNSPHIQTRLAAVRALEEFGDKRAVLPLISSLKVPELITAVAQALTHLGDMRAVEPLVRRLRNLSDILDLRLQGEVIKALVEALVKLDVERAIAVLIALIDENQYSFHTRFFQNKLIEIGSVAIPDLFLYLTTRESPDVYLASALGKIGDQSITLDLVGALETTNPKQRGMILWALSDLRDPRGIEAATRYLSDPNDEVRREARRALQACASAGPHDWFSVLEQALDVSDMETQVVVLYALAYATHAEATEVIVTKLFDPNPSIRIHAANALGIRGDPSAREMLQIAENDPVPEVRKAVVTTQKLLRGRRTTNN